MTENIKSLPERILSGTTLRERSIVEIKMTDDAIRAADEYALLGGGNIDLGNGRILKIPVITESTSKKKLTVEIKKATDVDPNSEAEEIYDHPLSSVPLN